MSRKLMPESGVLVPHVVMNRDAAVAGVFAVDGEKGSIDLTKKYVLIAAFDQKIGEVGARIKTIEDTIVTINTSITNINAALKLKAGSGVNSDITELRGLQTALTVTQGGTGASTPAGARKNLELGTASTWNVVTKNFSSEFEGVKVVTTGYMGLGFTATNTPASHTDANSIDYNCFAVGGGANGKNFYDNYTPIMTMVRAGGDGTGQVAQFQVSTNNNFAIRLRNSNVWSNWSRLINEGDYGIGPLKTLKPSGLGYNSGFISDASGAKAEGMPGLNGAGWNAGYDSYRRAQFWIGGDQKCYYRWNSNNDLNDQTVEWKRLIYNGELGATLYSPVFKNYTNVESDTGYASFTIKSKAAPADKVGGSFILETTPSGNSYILQRRTDGGSAGQILTNLPERYGRMMVDVSEHLQQNVTPFNFNNYVKHDAYTLSFANSAGNAPPSVAYGVMLTLGNGSTTGTFSYAAQQVFNKANQHVLYRTKNDTSANDWSIWHTYWTTANTTVDSNGFVKRASPVVKLFGDGSFEANEEAKGVAVDKLDTGHYLVRNVLGFNSDQPWEIVIPKDTNDQNLIWVDYMVRADGDIEVFTYHRTYPDSPVFARNTKRGLDGKEIENGAPIDIPQYRWVDLRLHMPNNE